jgi:cytochrome c
MDDRFNTTAGWVLFAGIVALGASVVTSEIFHGERPEKMGYPIEGVVLEGEGAEAEKPIEVYLATADVAKGQQIFNKCAACHTVTKGGPNGLGPNIWGVLGDPVADAPGFTFTDALEKKGGTWNWHNLSEWLHSPREFAPGTKMTFAGLGNPQDRANLIAYLNQQDDGPLPLPAAPAAVPAAAPAAGDKAAPADGNAAAPAEGNVAAPEPKKP